MDEPVLQWPDCFSEQKALVHGSVRTWRDMEGPPSTIYVSAQDGCLVSVLQSGKQWDGNYNPSDYRLSGNGRTGIAERCAHSDCTFQCHIHLDNAKGGRRAYIVHYF